jgi:hypothetical protein
MYCNGCSLVPLCLIDPIVIFQYFYILGVSLFIGLLKSLLKGKEVARKRWLLNHILHLGLEVLLQLQSPTKAKVVNLSQQQSQIIVLNHDHIPNPEEVLNPIQGHQLKGAQDHHRKGQGHPVSWLEKEGKIEVRVQRATAVGVRRHHLSTQKKVCSI